MRSLGRNALMLVLLCYSLHSGKKKKKKQTRGILCVKKSAKIRKREHNLLQMYSNAKAHAANGNKVVSLSSDCTALPHTSVTLAPCKFSRLREHSINSSARFDPLLQILNTQSSESRRWFKQCQTFIRTSRHWIQTNTSTRNQDNQITGGWLMNVNLHLILQMIRRRSACWWTRILCSWEAVLQCTFVCIEEYGGASKRNFPERISVWTNCHSSATFYTGKDFSSFTTPLWLQTNSSNLINRV